MKQWNVDSSVGIVTRLLAELQMNSGSIPGNGKDFSPLHSTQTYPAPLPPAYPAVGTRGYLLESKATERESGIRLHLVTG